ncbi:EamA-like transporter family protein [Leptospira fainei serovar Hurstbridge str. BUT 6]|uniref:EamA-like transporter family protein n=1 Tax=Leptospira fainei serovar Hurstbridge str. BUT 6 TaxID=1193011 RepID=S3VCN6_9LEPT|nr:DMT family transporter [Leptospira fainei]EPG74245.1 EamA-like transporter family protein [Leptospira fainei serovar Hurstbridge str. BUT 6]
MDLKRETLLTRLSTGTTEETKGFIYALLGTVLFSSKGVLVKLVYNYGVDSVTVLAFRMLFAIPFFAFILYRESNRTDQTPISSKDYVNVVVLAFIGYYLASFFDFWGLEYLAASMERLVLFTYPALVLLLSFLFLGKKAHSVELYAVALTYSGILLAFLPDAEANGQKSILGAALVFLSALAYSVYLIGSGQMIPKLGSRRFTALLMLWSGGFVLLHFFLRKEVVSIFSQPWPVYAYGFALGFLTTVLPAFLTTAGIQRIGSNKASIAGSAGPIFTLFLSAGLLNEQITWENLGGTALVLSGVLLLSRKKAIAV